MENTLNSYLADMQTVAFYERSPPAVISAGGEHGVGCEFFDQSSLCVVFLCDRTCRLFVTEVRVEGIS